ncbi:DNA-binding transcriptional LysR family regulator [Sinobacterium caligoides]|uniref:DNA-binding transcriptional LysR family regulator n=1 Tax=Sinobacterium caligoides TaxID=933926 RepID=A0A3N2DNK0_9GAMM|nr:LysR family transcriptional regulator [Sinobacterium caligoides]ROS01386.1 DNA-binding transcriptional LysR family regulator [Sinobacterium caligoides]
MDWDDLRFFLAVARSGTVSGAADKMSVNYTTVSRRLKQFEERLGMPLFDRLQNRYTLTDEGRNLLQSVSVIDHEFEKIERQLLGQDERLQGVIRIDTTDHIAELLMPHLQQFMSQHPGIELQIITNAKTIDLSKRDADISLRVTDKPPSHLVSKRVGLVTANVYASSHYLATHRQCQQLSDHNWIGWDTCYGGGAAARLIESLMPQGASISCRVNSGMALRQAIQAGIGIGHMWDFVAEQEGGLQRVDNNFPTYKLGLWLLIHRDVHRSARMQVFITFIEEILHRYFDDNDGCLVNQ